MEKYKEIKVIRSIMKTIAEMVDESCTESDEDKMFTEKIDKLLLVPLALTNKNQGKRFRHKLTGIFNYWTNASADDKDFIANTVQTLHISSLLIDDIQDKSVLRRGYPAAYTIVGVPKVLTCVGYLIGKVQKHIHDRGGLAGVRLYSEHILLGLAGQSQEMYHREKGVPPTEEQYYQMVVRKTGFLFMTIVDDLNRKGKTKYDFTKIAVYLSLVFQIGDDLKNLTDKEFYDKKGYCEDLSEGKFGFPVIHAIQSRPNDNSVLDIVKERPTDYERKRQCVKLLEEFGSFDYTRKKIDEFRTTLMDELAKLDSNPYMHDLYSFHDKKGYCEDLSEGKFGFPVIHAIQSRPNDNSVLDVVKERPTEYERNRQCVKLLEEFGSFDYTRKKKNELRTTLMDELVKLDFNPYTPDLYSVISHSKH